MLENHLQTVGTSQGTMNSYEQLIIEIHSFNRTNVSVVTHARSAVIGEGNRLFF